MAFPQASLERLEIYLAEGPGGHLGCRVCNVRPMAFSNLVLTTVAVSVQFLILCRTLSPWRIDLLAAMLTIAHKMLSR